MKYQKLKLLFFIILFIGIFLRFFELEKRFVFDIDVMYQSLYAQTIVKDFHLIWIGVSASNVGYYLGPALVYLTAFLFKIYNDPVVLGLFSSSVGIITIGSIYYVSKNIYNQKVALIATSIYSFTLFIANYDRKFWPIFIPLVGIWMYYGLVKLHKNINFLILLAFLIGISFHIHLSLILFIPIVLYAIFLNLNVKSWKTYLASISIYLAMTSPLIVYDFVHNFDNLLLPIRLFSKGSNGIAALPALDAVTLAMTKNKLQLAKDFFIPLIPLIFILFKKSELKTNYLKSIIIVFLLAVLFYPGPFQQYYLVLIFPFFALSIGVLLEKFNTKILIIAFTVYALFNIYSFLNIKNIKELKYKKNIITNICPRLPDNYRLVVEGEGRDYSGWYYLFTHYCKRPSNSDVDQMFGWLYQSEIKDVDVNQPIIYPNQLK